MIIDVSNQGESPADREALSPSPSTNRSGSVKQTDNSNVANMPLTKEIANTAFMDSGHLEAMIRDSQARASCNSKVTPYSFVFNYS